MHVIVVGCGRVGSELAVNLDKSGHTVAVVDKNKRAFRRLPEDWSGTLVNGFGFDRDDLDEAGAGHADALAAVTSGDNSNVLTARIARENYQISHVVARIYDPRRAAIYQRLGIPTVATVTWTTDQVMRRLLPETTATEWSDPTGGVSMIERNLPPQWAGRTLNTLIADPDMRLVMVTRAGTAQLAASDTVGQEGDVLTLAVRNEAMSRIDEQFGHQTQGAKQ